jgi:hypothetical protein
MIVDADREQGKDVPKLFRVESDSHVVPFFDGGEVLALPRQEEKTGR